MSRRSENTALNLQSSQLKLNKYHVLFFVIEQVMETKGIPVENIRGFLDHLKDAYEGIDEVMRKKMEGIEWGSEWSHKIMEFKKPEAENESGAKYGMVVFVKSKDRKFVDCMYCLYKLDFKVAPAKVLIEKERSILWGLLKWETVEKKVQKRVLGPELLKRIENFFRYKALEGFYRQGLIDQINVVPSLQHMVDEN